ncbi:MAG TPA: 30S ribosomal protein S1 [Candidatus Acidoferrales bacterium]|nr:30S ribosomal protein S1 [Candidatus Acidoferrales bacterium]
MSFQTEQSTNPSSSSAAATEQAAEAQVAVPPAVASVDMAAPDSQAAQTEGSDDAGRAVSENTAAQASGSDGASSAGAAEAATDAAEGDEISAEALNELIDHYPTPQEQAAEHRELEGRVVAISELGVAVDIGAKSEGLIPAQEFSDNNAAPLPAIGETIPVERLGEQKDGYILLSYQKPRRRAIWKKIEESYKAKANIEGKVVDLIKGGLVVDIGIRAFLPASQVDVKPQSNLESLKEQAITVRVIKMNRKRGNVVVSRRAILEEDNEAKKQQVLESLAEGQTLTGRVKNITDYGAFVDLGGVDGLLHITDLSWGRLKHPSEAVKVGDEVEVQVLRFDKEKGRVSLGRKQLVADPWATVPEKFPVGAHIQGKVAGVTDYGAFIELDQGVEGLVHISEMTWSKRLKHPSKIVSVGDTVEVVVLDVKPDQRRISLGLKQATPDPWTQLSEKYPIGTVVSGRVRNLTDFGAFVEIEEGFDGLIHVSDISWSGRVKNPSESFKKGDTVTAKVLKIDRDNRRVSLGIKQVNDIWANWFSAHKVGEVVHGKVSRLATFGAFVELAEGIEGLCHISEIEDRKRKDKDKNAPGGGQKPSAAAKSPLELGKEYDFKIVKLDTDQHRIGLSYRAAVKQAERREMEEYRSAKSSATATIGDAILSKGRPL